MIQDVHTKIDKTVQTSDKGVTTTRSATRSVLRAALLFHIIRHERLVDGVYASLSPPPGAAAGAFRAAGDGRVQYTMASIVQSASGLAVPWYEATASLQTEAAHSAALPQPRPRNDAMQAVRRTWRGAGLSVGAEFAGDTKSLGPNAPAGRAAHRAEQAIVPQIT